MTLTAGLYCRISKDTDGTNLGVDRQQKLCRKLAKDRGWPIGEVYVENDVSAFKGKRRPEFERMISDIAAGRIGAIVAVDQDRLARRMQDLLDVLRVCEDNRVPIVLHSGEIDTTSADGMLKAHILGAVAENESRKKSERIKRQRDQLAAAGRPHGGGRRPYGYDRDQMTVRPDEATVIHEAADRVLAGESVRQIAYDFNGRGIPSSSGELWSVASLRTTLTGPRIAGLRVHRGEQVGDATWPAILDRRTWERVRSILGDPRVSKRGRPPTSLLTSILVCGKCANLMRAGRDRHGARLYRCHSMPDSDACGRLSITAERTEQLVVDKFLDYADSPAVAKAKSRLSKTKKRARQEDTVDLAALDADIAALAADHGEGRISRAEWLSARTPLLRRRDEALKAIAAESPSNGVGAYTGVGVLRKAWPNLNLEQQRAILKEVVESIDIAPATVAGRFDVDRIAINWIASKS